MRKRLAPAQPEKSWHGALAIVAIDGRRVVNVGTPLAQTTCRGTGECPMGRDDLLRQADNADRHADQAIDDNLKAVLLSLIHI